MAEVHAFGPYSEDVVSATCDRLTPLKLMPFYGYVLCFSGTDLEARASGLLKGRGLPGDAGLNKTQFHFDDEGRRINVFRQILKGGTRVTVHVGMTECEDQQEKLRRNAERRAAEPELVDEPTAHRGTLLLWTDVLKRIIANGNDTAGPMVDGKFGPPTVMLEPNTREKAIETLSALRAMLATARIERITGASPRPILEIVDGSGLGGKRPGSKAQLRVVHSGWST